MNGNTSNEKSNPITKTRLFKYIENFHLQKLKKSDKKLLFFILLLQT